MDHAPPPLKKRTKAAWATGAMADVFMANSFSYLALPIYNVALKVDPVLLGWAMGLPRIWDAFADAFIGNISDNTRTRWGRRRPFIFAGAIASGAFFALVWMPPASAGTMTIAGYFFAISLLYYTAYAVFTVPWGALGLQLTSDYAERTNVQAWKNVFQATGGVFLGVLWWLSLRIGDNEIEGVRWVGIIFGCLIALAGIIPAIFLRESGAGLNQPKMPFWPAVKSTFSNRAFLCLIGFTLCIVFGIFTVNAFALYINILHVFGGDKEAVSSLNMVMNTVFQFSGLLMTPFIAWGAHKIGKRHALGTGLCFVIVGFLTSWWTYTPAAPYLQGVTLALISIGLACLWIIGPSMLADVCDLDELSTGRRREGMYSASYAWAIKAGIAFTMVLSGYMLNFAGYDATLEGAQAPGVVDRLRLLYMFVPAGLTMLALLFVYLYPLTEARAQTVREKLRDRQPSPAEGTDCNVS